MHRLVARLRRSRRRRTRNLLAHKVGGELDVWTTSRRGGPYRQGDPRGAVQPRYPDSLAGTTCICATPAGEVPSATALPHPGDREHLRSALAGVRQLSHRLDMRRPLWEMWLIEGLEDGQFAILNKVHPRWSTDSCPAPDIMETLLDESPDVAAPGGVPTVGTSPTVRPPVRVLPDAVVDTTRISLGRLGHLAADLSDRARRTSPREAVNQNGAAAVVGTTRIGETWPTEGSSAGSARPAPALGVGRRRPCCGEADQVPTRVAR